MKNDNIPIGQYINEDGDGVRDLLSHLKFEKPNRDFSESILQKLENPPQAYNPLWESLYLLVIFSILFFSFYFFVKPGEDDLDQSGLIRGLSGQDKLIFGFLGVTSAIIFTFFVARFRRYKARLIEIEKMPQIKNTR